MTITRREMLAGLTTAVALRGAPPRPTYSEAEIGARFERPRTVAQLIQNLKIAFDADLLLQPAFAAPANLMRFFNGTAVSRTPAASPADAPFKERVISTVTVDQSVFPGMQAQVEQGVAPPSDAYPPFPRMPADVPTYGSMDLVVRQLEGFDVSLVRSVFGPETKVVIADALPPAAPGYYGQVKGALEYDFPGTDADGRRYDGKLLRMGVLRPKPPKPRDWTIVAADRIGNFREAVSQH
jgi:hypothetical protein